MAVAGCINAYDCSGCYLTTLQQLQSDNIGVAINYTAPGEYGRRQLDYIKYTDKCGCTCCLTGENELRIVATQGVIKNFTLTNDDTNERVNVKWNDLFGSNRAYTMVRYKTGSYPTSISDGTLAVKETTQNQYSVSGYNVSGLTDGTTYYFTAFAVDSNNNVITSQNKTIVPEFDWKPRATTVAYFPLYEDFIDKVTGNGPTSSTGTIPFNTIGGVVAAYSNGGTLIKQYNNRNFTTGNNPFTWLMWCYKLAYQTEWQVCVSTGYGTGTRAASFGFHNNQFWTGGWTNDTYHFDALLNQRALYSWTFDGSTTKAYLNGVLKNSKAMTYNVDSNNYSSLFSQGAQRNGSSGPSGTDQTLYGYMSRVICENYGWSDGEHLAYFNKTKKYFGL